jgi:hypothetical protein
VDSIGTTQTSSPLRQALIAQARDLAPFLLAQDECQSASDVLDIVALLHRTSDAEIAQYGPKLAALLTIASDVLAPAVGEA